MCIFLPRFELYFSICLENQRVPVNHFYDHEYPLFFQYHIPISFWRAKHKQANLIIILGNLSDIEIQAN